MSLAKKVVPPLFVGCGDDGNIRRADRQYMSQLAMRSARIVQRPSQTMTGAGLCDNEAVFRGGDFLGCMKCTIQDVDAYLRVVASIIPDHNGAMSGFTFSR